eukprot:610584-Pelagomonas_calceolata.AAC.1
MMTFWKRAYKASGSFKVDRMFLVVEGACAVLENCAFHTGWETGHVQEGIANALICMSMHMGFPGKIFKGLESESDWEWGRKIQVYPVLPLPEPTKRYCGGGCRLGQR